MGKIKAIVFGLVLSSTTALIAFGDGTSTNSAAATNSAASSTNALSGGSGTNATRQARSGAPKQADLASKIASFGVVGKDDSAYKSAIDAHALDDALKMVDKEGGFKGTVAKVYEPRGLAIVEFDENYRNALTAIVRANNFTNFPALTNLVGKEILVTGKFTKFRDAAQVVLEKPDQIKILNETKDGK